MKISPMKSRPTSRLTFEHNLFVLKEQMSSGKFHMARGLALGDALLRVRTLPNGRLDMLSIDENVRLTANTTVAMQASFDEFIDGPNVAPPPQSDDE